MQSSSEDAYFDWLDGFAEDKPDEKAQQDWWNKCRDNNFTVYVGPNLDVRDVPIIVRAGLIYHNAPSDKFAEEREKVMNYTVELFDGIITISSLAEKYFTEELYNSIKVEYPEEEEQGLYGIWRRLGVIIQMIDTSGNESVIRAIEASTRLQEPVAELAKKQLQDRVIEHDNILRSQIVASEKLIGRIGSR